MSIVIYNQIKGWADALNLPYKNESVHVGISNGVTYINAEKTEHIALTEVSHKALEKPIKIQGLVAWLHFDSYGVVDSIEQIKVYNKNLMEKEIEILSSENDPKRYESLVANYMVNKWQWAIMDSYDHYVLITEPMTKKEAKNWLNTSDYGSMKKLKFTKRKVVLC